MGNVCGGGKEGDGVNKAISKLIEDDRKKYSSEIRLLLLGAGESGKSTIAKQMKIIHQEGFTEEDMLGYRPIIYSNTYAAMKTLIQAASELQINIKTKEHRKIASNFVQEDYFQGEISPQVASDIKELWSDIGIQKTFNRASEFQLTDNAKYYIDNVDRLASEDYIPSQQDVLRSRAKTTGIIETEFSVGKNKFKMTDVGGQRSERKKWMHCFSDVTAVIFCVAISAYDQKLYEDNETNRMHESMRLFKEICNSKWFVDTSMILFLNKKDLFEEKIKVTPLTECFPEYDGPQEYEACAEYVEQKFVEQNENQKKQIYTHLTCATDTGHVEAVFEAVKDIILQKALDRAGLGQV